MKSIRNLVLVGISCFAIVFLTSFSQNEWEVLGEKKINLSLESDVFKLGAKEGRYSALKFKILNQSVYIHHIKIEYGNGEEDIKLIKRKVKAGGSTGSIDLPGNKRIIKNIKFLYKTNRKAKRRATIVVLGK